MITYAQCNWCGKVFIKDRASSKLETNYKEYFFCCNDCLTKFLEFKDMVMK